jgi:hypothetical protein
LFATLTSLDLTVELLAEPAGSPRTARLGAGDGGEQRMQPHGSFPYEALDTVYVVIRWLLAVLAQWVA